MIIPLDFKTRTLDLLGDEYYTMEAALQTVSPVSVRINETKSIKALDAQSVDWCNTGYYIPERIPFTFDPLLHAGTYYVQEASSMFLEHVVKTFVTEPVRCLDLCAAPGGKSTHLCSLLPEGSLLVCNEVIRSRSHILAENIIKWGNPATVVCNNDPEEIGRLTNFFDIIVADLPCSGEGMFRKDPQSAEEWSVNNVQLCAARQRKIIHNVWNALRPGGLLIYSTCTYNLEENEENIHTVTEELKAEALNVEIKGQWNIGNALKYDNTAYRFFPQRTKGEGFFMAVLRKTGEEISPFQMPKDKKKPAFITDTHINSMLKQSELFKTELFGNVIKAYPATLYESFSFLSRNLRIVNSGVTIGEIKGKDIVPAHALAMSTAINRNCFTVSDVDWSDAISFLQRDTFTLSTEKGYVLLTYKDTPLGFVKQLGNRINNLYPQEWRIRTHKRPEIENPVSLPGLCIKNFKLEY